MAEQNTVSLSDLYINKAGTQDTTLGRSLYGIHTAYTPLSPSKNRNLQGKVFFTRPLLNLSDDNIRGHRDLVGLLGGADYSIYRWARATLDPRIMKGVELPSLTNTHRYQEAIPSPLTNNQQAFIPILTNQCTKVSGWADSQVPVYVSPPGNLKEVYMQTNGSAKVAGPIDLTVSFENSVGEPIVALIGLWTKYTGLEFAGKLFPYIDVLWENEIDYNTRIFKVIYDHTGRYVARIASTFPAIWTVGQLGGSFDHDRTKPNASNADELTYSIKTSSIEYDDPIHIYEFNDIVQIFKPAMEENVREDLMIQVPFRFIKYFDSLTYNRINPDTLEFEHWVDVSIWTKVANYYNARLDDDVEKISLN